MLLIQLQMKRILLFQYNFLTLLQLMKIKSLLTVIRVFLLLNVFIFAQNSYSQKKIEKNLRVKALKDSKRNLKFPVGYINDFENLFTQNIISINEKYVTTENFDSLILATDNLWGVGRAGLNNGILIGISCNLKRIRISNGDGVRDKLTDKKTKNIIEEIMIPEFKKNNFFIGLMKGINGIIKILK
jgi:uncharacterized protein